LAFLVTLQELLLLLHSVIPPALRRHRLEFDELPRALCSRYSVLINFSGNQSQSIEPGRPQEYNFDVSAVKALKMKDNAMAFS
jgi:hypothetical protein